MDLKQLLILTIQNKASDLHLLSGVPPVLRVDGALVYLAQFPALTHQQIEQLLFSILNPEEKELLLANKELDFSYGVNDVGFEGRFRVNIYYQLGQLAGAFRFLPNKIPTIESLSLPKVLHTFTQLRQGFVLVVGPTGQGKSTTLASLINEINQTMSSHVLTIEDPIEYVYPKGKSIISQREMGIDTHSWATALRSALREDPDVVLIGEMRDPETMAAAISIAETGHLVFSTLHTNSAAQTIDRIVGSFTADQQQQIRTQLASTLKGIVSQRLLPQISGGRIPATEVLIGTPAISSNIRDGKTHLIDSVIQTSQEQGMMTLESSLAALVISGAITLDIAKQYTQHPDELFRLVG